MTGSHIGKTIYVASGAPATNDAAGFEALTWVKIAGWQQLPQLGVTHSTIDVPDGETGFTSALKGAATGVDTGMAFKLVAGDAGQEDIRDLANGQGGACSIKIGKGSGASNALVSGDPVQYAQGLAHSYSEFQGDDNTHEGLTVNLKQNDYTVDATEPSA